MAEVVLQFETPVTDAEGRVFFAAACARELEDGRWEGWLEFDPHDGTSVLRTPQETTQPGRDSLEHWATRLGGIYLQGALARAQRPRWVAPAVIYNAPKYDAPAEHLPYGAPDTVADAGEARGILDPFAVYAQGEDVLRSELNALGAVHLRNVVRAYELIPVQALDLQSLGPVALSELIVAAVRNSPRSSR